ncbi:MAG: hypothetical protein WAL25_14485, partial [Acidimicrobiia bacterium]
EDSPRGLSFNASKLIPTDWARHIRYDDRLASGQDIAFYGGLYATYDFVFGMVPATFDAVYHRSLSDDSQSRRQPDFEFAVQERLAVIESLAERLPHAPNEKRPVLNSLMRAQALFIRRFLDENPESRRTVNKAVFERSIPSFPWDVLTTGAATTLVVSVCFPPYSDASAVTVAKRINESGNVVDVLCCDMSEVRGIDLSLELLVLGLVGSAIEVTSDVSFSNWSNIRQFVSEGVELAETLDAWPYEQLYSRAMWPASHILAAAIKLRRPSTHWVAEFSDPLSRDVGGRPRPGTLPDDQFVDQLLASASNACGIELPVASSVFALAELLPYALADEVVFTNGAQMRYMLSYCPSDELTQLVEEKATIAPHPVPSDELYRLVKAVGPDHGDKVALGYFGSFYENRSLQDLLLALSTVPDEVRRGVALDVYTAQGDQLEQVITDRALGDIVSVRSTVGYLEFLNLTTQYDCLVVEDAVTSQTHQENPYLPSKWSDYRGSGTAVWAFTEPGSTLSGLSPQYQTHLGDTTAAVATLTELVDHSARSERDLATAADATPNEPGH